MVVEKNLPNIESDGQETESVVDETTAYLDSWIVGIFQLLKHVGEYLNFQFSFDIHLLKD